jgi:hypothetical protein
MKKFLGFFSSDARPLYTEDIYRVLALPQKSIIHFRYDQKYVADDIITNLQSLVGNEGVVFFLTGNDLSKNPEERIISTHSIRKIIIKKIT